MSRPPEEAKNIRYKIATELYHKHSERFDIVPICDKLGFSQHEGECWIDTVQELFFYTDELKELTQPLFYHLKDEEIETRVNNSTDIDPLEKDDYIHGLQSMRDRFIQHYDFMMHNIEIKSCQDPRAVHQMYKVMSSSEEPSEENPSGKKPTPLIASLRTKSAIFARNIGMRFQTLKRKAERTPEIPYNPGGTDRVEEIVLNRLFKLFNLPFQLNAGSSSPTLAIGIAIAAFKKKDVTSKNGYVTHTNLEMITNETHVTGFLKCDNKWYYYDDNNGLWSTSDYIIEQVMFCKEHKIDVGVHREKSDGKVYLYAFDWHPLESEEDIEQGEKDKKMANSRGNICLLGKIRILNICTEDGWSSSLDHPVLKYLNNTSVHKYDYRFQLNAIKVMFSISKDTESSIAGGRPSMKFRNKKSCRRTRLNRRRSTRRSKLLT